MSGSAEEAKDRQLLDFLKQVRQDLGLSDSAGVVKVPAAVRRHLGIDASLSPERQSSQLRGVLSRSLKGLDREHPTEASYVRVALNLESSDDKWLARVERRAELDGRSRKTVLRKIDAALTLLVARLGAQRADQSGSSPPETVALARLKRILERHGELVVSEWHVTVRVFDDHVEVHERIKVVSQSDNAQFYVVGKTLPYKTSEVETTVLDGAELLEVEQPNAHWLLELIEMPSPVPRDESHLFTVLHDTRGMAPMWTATGQHQIETMTVRVWYADRVARPTWMIDRFPPNLLRGDDIEPILQEHATELEVDKSGTAEHTFTNMEREHTYGLAWTNHG